MKQRVIPRDYQLDPDQGFAAPRRFPSPQAGREPARRGAGAFHQSGDLPRRQEGRQRQHRAPFDRDARSGRRHPRGGDGRSRQLDINDSLHLTALPLPAGCRPTQRDRDFTIVTLSPPLVVPEDAAAAAAAAASRPARRAARLRRRQGCARRRRCPAPRRKEIASPAGPPLPFGKRRTARSWIAVRRRP